VPHVIILLSLTVYIYRLINMTNTKRKGVGAKLRAEVLKVGNYTCVNCGRSPAIHPGLPLEIDHIVPFSLGGNDDISNFQILCRDCNRGKGNDDNLNRTVQNEIDAILNYINPQILVQLKNTDSVSVVANQEDFAKIMVLNLNNQYYIIKPTTNSIFGFQVMKSIGIYTIHDNHGSKVHFFISIAASQ